MDIRIKAFLDLTLDELYALLKLREEVFILEQNILYPDLGQTDQMAFHIMIFENNHLVAYARAFEKGIKYANTFPILEKNHKVHEFCEYFNAIPTKRRRCYIKPVSDRFKSAN